MYIANAGIKQTYIADKNSMSMYLDSFSYIVSPSKLFVEIILNEPSFQNNNYLLLL